jgi:hypothetical protein
VIVFLSRGGRALHPVALGQVDGQVVAASCCRMSSASALVQLFWVCSSVSRQHCRRVTSGSEFVEEESGCGTVADLSICSGRCTMKVLLLPEPSYYLLLKSVVSPNLGTVWFALMFAPVLIETR